MIYNEKKCKSCGEVKPLGSFHKRASAKDGHQPVCKPCAIAKVVQYQRDNADRVLARIKAWGEANKEKTLEYKAKWKAKNKERNAAINAEWKRSNAEAVRSASNKKNAIRRQATPAWANQFFISEAYDLARLRTKATGIKWSVDHIIPLSGENVCGLHVESNLQVIPLSENCRKGTRLMVVA